MASIKHERRTLKSGKVRERWIVSYYAGPSGARTRQYEAFDSKRAAERFKVNVEEQERRGEVLAHDTSPTVRQACETYLRACATGTRQSKRAKKALREQTIEQMRARLTRWLYGHDISDRLLSQLTRRDVSGYADWLMTESGAGARELELAFQHLKAALAEARLRGEIHQNFWSDLSARKAISDAVDADDDDDDESDVWSDIPSHAEAAHLIETARRLRDEPNAILGWRPDDAPWRRWRANASVSGGRGHAQLARAWRRYYPLTATAIWTGLRMSELRALQRRDVDIEQRIIRVRRSADKKGRINRPKSAAGRRIVPIPEPLVEILRERLTDVDTDPKSYVWSTSGGPLRIEQVYKAWGRLLGYSGIERPLRWHGLRAYYATCHASAGTPPNHLMKMLGHEDPKTTFAIYARIHQEDVRVMIAAADAVAGMAKPAAPAEAAE